MTLPQPALRVTLPSNIHPRLTLEEESLFLFINIDLAFLTEYVLSRWTDYIHDWICGDPQAAENIYGDIAEYVDGNINYARGETSAEIEKFSEHFTKVLDVIRRIYYNLQPFVSVYPNHFLDEQVILISHRQYGNTLSVLEFWPTESDSIPSI